MIKTKRKVDKNLLAKVKDFPCCVCGRGPSDPHHIKTKKSGGPDEVWNLTPLCRQHHTEIHAIGLTSFANKHEAFIKALTSRGWVYDEARGKWGR